MVHAVVTVDHDQVNFLLEGCDQGTLFEIGSITKTFTTLLLAQAVLEGLVSLEDLASKYLDAFEGKSIRLIHLASHTSGLPLAPDLPKGVDPLRPYDHFTRDDILSLIRTCTLSCEPGTEHAYSNVGIAAVGILIETIYGKPFVTLVQEKITQPLGMLHTGVEIDANTAQGHMDGQAVPPWQMDGYVITGGLRSSIGDMSRYLQAHLGAIDTPLAESIALTHRTFSPGFGLAWAIDGDTLSHAGVTGGFQSFMGIIPTRKRGVVVLTNDASGEKAERLRVGCGQIDLEEEQGVLWAVSTKVTRWSVS